tara:strand:+ start:3748 stop:4248 length:501 start_codon:yes stop_codon:yes gene_type:complete
MIDVRRRDIFNVRAEALVNPVNCVGVMGAGLARQFRTQYPEIETSYQEACKDGTLYPGVVHVYDRGGCNGTRIYRRWIINFPTKRHFSQPSELRWVRDGLLALTDAMCSRGIMSVAIPALGAGLGGLPWQDVLDCIRLHFKGLPSVEVFVCEPIPVRPRHAQEATQ